MGSHARAMTKMKLPTAATTATMLHPASFDSVRHNAVTEGACVFVDGHWVTGLPTEAGTVQNAPRTYSCLLFCTATIWISRRTSSKIDSCRGACPALSMASSVAWLFIYIYIYVCLSIYLSIYLSMHLSIYPSIHPSIDLSIYCSIVLSFFRSF